MDLKASIGRARKLARERKREMVVGKENGAWTILPLDDPASDQMRPAMIVDADGLRYPEDHELVARLISRGE